MMMDMDKNGDQIVDGINQEHRRRKRTRGLEDNMETVENSNKIVHPSNEINEDNNYQNDPEVRMILK